MARNTFDWSVLPQDGEHTRTLLPGGVELPPVPDEPRVLAGRYVLGEAKGRGGGGQVFRARDRLTGETVAVKLLPALPPGEGWRVRRELTALRWLRLPGVVRMRDSGPAGKGTFIVMDEVQGSGFPGQAAPVSWETLEPTALELLEILARVHHAGVIHRDLKPANVLVDSTGRPVVLDFGIAHGRPLFSAEQVLRPEGTPAYVAPEQITGGSCDPRTDLYAVGVMLYEALVGEPPHGFSPFSEVIGRRLHQAAPSLARAAPAAPARVAEVVDRLLQRKPGERYASAADVLDALGAGGRTRLYAGAAARLPPERPASPEDLRALFRGPDPFFHLAEDGAAALWSRTGGQPRRVAEEVAGWVRAGLAWWEGDRLVVDRPSLERLRGGLAVTDARGAPESALAEEDARLLSWVRLAWPDATPALLEQLTGRSAAEIEAILARLRAADLIWTLPGGRIGAWPGLVVETAEARQANARRLAEVAPGGSEARLSELLLAEAPAEELLPEVLAEAEARLAEGEITRASAALELGMDLLHLLDEGDHAEAEDALLRHHVLAALAQESEPALERALYELGRASGATPLQEQLSLLVQGCLAARRRESERALQILDALAPFADEELEIWRQGTRCRAAAQQSAILEGALLDQLAGWAAGSPARAAKLAGWRGSWLYRQNRFQEAADQHLASLAAKSRPDARLASQLNAASALVEAERMEEALALAAQAEAQAAACRHPRYEALAVLLRRMTAYRLDRAGAPRPDLVEAAAPLGAYVESQFALNEAAVAWRAGARELAIQLAERARSAAGRARQADAQALAGALLLAARGDADPEELVGMVDRARRCRAPSIGVQILGLLRRSTPHPDPAWAAEAARLAAGRPRADWATRLDVLSYDEAISALAQPPTH